MHMHNSLYDHIISRANCPHFSLELINDRWTFVYADHEKGVYDRKVTAAESLRDYRREYWFQIAREFVKRHYHYPIANEVGVVTIKSVVHHIKMSTRAENDSFETFQLRWYGYAGCPETESTVGPLPDRVVHDSLWKFYEAIGWDHKRKRFEKDPR